MHLKPSGRDVWRKHGKVFLLGSVMLVAERSASEDMNNPRRHFFDIAAAVLAASQLALPGAALAQSSETNPAVKSGDGALLASRKQIDTGVLTVGYAEAGPADGAPVVLLHGWPYDIHSFVDVVPLLASRGCRVIVPYLRGYGPTHFLSSETARNGQQSVVAVDVLALMDALKIPKAILGGLNGAHARPISWRRSGPNIARRWSPSVAT